jgi:hypothetical protein
MKKKCVQKGFRWSGPLGVVRTWGLVCGRKVSLGFLLIVIGLSLCAQEPAFHLEGMASRSLPVTGRKMTNVIFPIDIAAGVRVSHDVLVQKVKGVENVIELKALKRDFAPTNLAVYGKDGRLYSFVLHYVEDTTVLDYKVVRDGEVAGTSVKLTGWPVNLERLRTDAQLLSDRRGFLRRHAKSEGLELKLKGIYLRDSLLWLSLDLRDQTAMGCGPGALRMYTEDHRKVKRTATQDLDIVPVYTGGIGAVPGFGHQAMAVGLHPLIVGQGKRLVIAFSDENGDRHVVLKVKGKLLVRSRKA